MGPASADSNYGQLRAEACQTVFPTVRKLILLGYENKKKMEGCDWSPEWGHGNLSGLHHFLLYVVLSLYGSVCTSYK